MVASELQELQGDCRKPPVDSEKSLWKPHKIPSGSKDLNNSALRPKYYNTTGI